MSEVIPFDRNRPRRDRNRRGRLRAVLALVVVAGALLSVPPSLAGAVEPTTSTSTTSTTIGDATVVTAPDGVVETTGGELVWGIRSSFVNYVRGPIAKGAIAVSGGAVDNTAVDGTFTFPSVAGGTFDGVTDDTDVAFQGAVRFTGHDSGQGPQLDLLIENLRVHRDATGSWLIGDVSSVPFEGTSGGDGAPEPLEMFPDLRIAALGTAGVLPVSTPPDGLTWYGLDSTLTEEAVPAFGFYAAGESMDPVTYTLTFEEVPDVPVDPIGPVSPVVTIDKATVIAGESLTASAPGFAPGEQVEVWLHSAPAWITTVVADAAGSVTATFVVPIDTPGGVHQIELRGISSGYRVRSADFTVVAIRAAGASGTTLPATGGDGRIALTGVVVLALGLALVTTSRRGRSPAER